jgi:hypothetical protein
MAWTGAVLEGRAEATNDTLHLVTTAGGGDHLARWSQGTSGSTVCGLRARPRSLVEPPPRRLCGSCVQLGWDQGFRTVQVAANAWVRLQPGS